MINTLEYCTKPHIVQSPEWGEFKTKMGTPAVRAMTTQFTVHPIPKTPWSVGYCPRPDLEKIDFPTLHRIGRDHRCIFIKVEPNTLVSNFQLPTSNLPAQAGFQLIPSRSIFATQTILLDLTKTEEQLLAAMHPKTRYNIGLARRKGVVVRAAEDKLSLESFIQLQRETAQRQGFFVHSDNYYRTCFEMLHPQGLAYLLLALLPQDHKTTRPQVLAAWMLFRYKNTLYYPYGGSDYQYRHLMASNLLMWEAIKLGQSLGCTVFDLWGACSDPHDPWYGFTRFKLGFGGKLVNFAPTFDLVIHPFLYPLSTLGDRFRWFLLKLKRRRRR